MKEKQKYIITIDEPCHEKWSDMQTQTGGRFCDSCAKSVIDFTKLSDNEIIRILENANGKSLCGRFEKEQLNKIMVQTNAEKNNPALYKILAGLLLLASIETVTGQNVQSPKTEEITTAPKNQIMGKIAMAPAVNGTVTDQKGKAVAGATVFSERTHMSVVTDKNGSFSINGYSSEKLKISKTGYDSQTVPISGNAIKIVLKKSKAVPKKPENSEIIMGGLGYFSVPKE